MNHSKSFKKDNKVSQHKEEIMSYIFNQDKYVLKAIIIKD